MAEGVVFDAAWKLLEVLGSQVFQQIDLASGVRDEIRKRKDTVETIKAVLLDATSLWLFEIDSLIFLYFKSAYLEYEQTILMLFLYLSTNWSQSFIVKYLNCIPSGRPVRLSQPSI
ncbi:hypothetical protein Patl1_05310 [Pistacia atlantica]|uniref:Uncharacterized protein n=1 Tax=Pistacia atlantica TaxID=434234 RepID=A0ACC1BU24_9ROSI|nr:hypothetical protein Patl1_05310 [Pistacia atlantica]